MPMRWKKDAPERGLRAVAAWPRSHWLRDEAKRVACVSPLDRYGSQWFWVAGWDSAVPHWNNCANPASTIDEAKAEAMAYVKSHTQSLSKQEKGGS